MRGYYQRRPYMKFRYRTQKKTVIKTCSAWELFWFATTGGILRGGHFDWTERGARTWREWQQWDADRATDWTRRVVRWMVTTADHISSCAQSAAAAAAILCRPPWSSSSTTSRLYRLTPPPAPQRYNPRTHEHCNSWLTVIHGHRQLAHAIHTMRCDMINYICVRPRAILIYRPRPKKQSYLRAKTVWTVHSKTRYAKLISFFFLQAKLSFSQPKWSSYRNSSHGLSHGMDRTTQS